MIGGMTKCGKYTAGEYLAKKPDVKRLRFVSVVMYPELLINPHMDPYKAAMGIPEDAQAESFCLNFPKAVEPTKEVYVVHGVFGPRTIEHIKKGLPDYTPKFLYINASFEMRVLNQIRCFERDNIINSLCSVVDKATEDVMERDLKKIRLGAEMTPTHFDYLIENKGTLDDFINKLDVIYNKIKKA